MHLPDRLNTVRFGTYPNELDIPKPVRQEGHHTRQVGQQVGVNGDGQFRATVPGWFDGPHDVGLGAALFADEQGVNRAVCGRKRGEGSLFGRRVD